jgi:hypothetical protein
MARTIITKADVERAEASLEAGEEGPTSRDESDRPITLGMASTNGRRKPRISGSPDAYLDKLVKYIPSEVVAAYLSLDLICRSSNVNETWIRWAILLFGFVATPIYLWRALGVQKIIQLAISMAAFCVWAFALGGPFLALSWYKPLYGALLLPVFTFLAPLIAPDARKTAVGARGP